MSKRFETYAANVTTSVTTNSFMLNPQDDVIEKTIMWIRRLFYQVTLMVDKMKLFVVTLAIK